MHCYLDDLRYDLMHIGNDVIISYGVYFACHGRNQVSQPIRVKDGAYIGMRASIISKNAGIPGGGGVLEKV
jgi:acetyltransferase-like isoleucine patch superfamily enzyme